MPLSKLNEEQKLAATAPLGHNLIIASAGTGKTSTIVARIAYLLKKGIKPNSILLLTFTNKAASEMITRIEKYFDKTIVKQIEAGTFHATSYRILKKLNKKIVIKQPKDLKILLKTIVDKRRFDQIDSTSKSYQASYLFDLFSLYKNTSLNKSFPQWLEENNPDQAMYGDIYEDILREFEEQKKKFSYVDFNDLLIYMKKELQKGAPIHFSEILIDEYQDTNPLQSALVEAYNSKSLFCVGDYDQSIYAFNGADISIIGSFNKRYKNANIFSLNKNYRSKKQILSLANKVISNNPRLYVKTLEVTRQGQEESPKLLVYDEIFIQYQSIATLISQSIVSHEKIAVIFRNNSSGDGIEACLRELGIASKRKGGISFFDSKEVKALIDLFTLVVNSKDMMAFVHICEYAQGVGPALSKELFDGLYRIGKGDIYDGLFFPEEGIAPFTKQVKNYQLGLFDDCVDFGSVGRFYNLGFDERFLSNPILKHPKLTKDGANFLFNLYNFLKEAKKIKSPQSLVQMASDSEVFKNIIELLSKKRGTKKDGSIDENLQNEAIQRIIRKTFIVKNLAKNYNDNERFLNALTLGSNEMSQGEGVNLLSVHASKGLEFEEVYLIDLMDGRFPNRKLMKTGGDIEEERRLFYVATTRAKDKLTLSYSKYDKIRKINYLHSPFLQEAGLLDFA